MTHCPLELDGVEYPIGENDAVNLADLTNHPGWDALLALMATMESAARSALEDPETPLDKVRELQGRLGVATNVNGLLNQGIPTWLAAMSKETN